MPHRAKAYFEKFPSDLAKMTEALPDTIKAFGGLFQSVMKNGALRTKEKELIALGIAVAQRCGPCINLHVQKCLGAGSSREEILEAASVAVMMQGGPAYTHIAFVLDALEALEA
ncbi:carboxymuconolactone decarboxylase family protein [bacterium]|nr:carboxymuconolactone decarboxylase family protein [bacterium]